MYAETDCVPNYDLPAYDPNGKPFHLVNNYTYSLPDYYDREF